MKKIIIGKLILSFLLLLCTPLILIGVGNGFLIASAVATGGASVFIAGVGWIVCTGWGFLLASSGPVGVGLVAIWGL